MKINKVLYWLLIIILATVMVVSGTLVVRYLLDSARQNDAYDELAALVENSRVESDPSESAATAPVTGLPESTEETKETEPVILPDYAALLELNNDMVGWMTIEGTPIDYPVMQTPDRPDYYLERNFYHEHNAHGCLYVRESCDVFAPSDNVTVYGHHMKDGSMFAGLKKFYSQSFWEEYPTIRFDTLYEHRTYTIFAVFTTTASVDRGFSYHSFENAIDEADFDDFIATCKALSLFDTGITPKYGDKIICLSTCEYSRDNGRLVVAAVLNP